MYLYMSNDDLDLHEKIVEIKGRIDHMKTRSHAFSLSHINRHFHTKLSIYNYGGKRKAFLIAVPNTLKSDGSSLMIAWTCFLASLERD